jgi:hypothetical protein
VKLSGYHRIIVSAGILFLLLHASSLQAQEEEPPVPGIIEEPGEDSPGEKDRQYYFIYKQYRDSPPALPVRYIPASRMREVKGEKAFWYADAVFETPPEKTPDIQPYVPLTQRDWFKTLIWLIIIGGFAAFLMIYLSGNQFGIFRRKAVPLLQDEEESMPEDIFAIQYQREIDKAVNQGNFRLAVRLMYLRALREMSEKGVIRYTQDKTNFEYLIQVHPTPFYPAFFKVTRDYEFTWYGKFPVNEEAFHVIRKDFDDLENKLGK